MSKRFLQVMFGQDAHNGTGEWKAVFTRVSVDAQYREQGLQRRGTWGYGDPCESLNNSVIRAVGLRAVAQMGESVAEALNISDIEDRIKNRKDHDSISIKELARGLEALKDKLEPDRDVGRRGNSHPSQGREFRRV